MASPRYVVSVPRWLPTKKLAPPSSAFVTDAECLKGRVNVGTHVLHQENGMRFEVVGRIPGSRPSPFAFVGKMNREQEKPSEAFRLEKGNEDFIDFPLERTSEASPGLPPGGKILLHARRGPSGLGSVS